MDTSVKHRKTQDKAKGANPRQGCAAPQLTNTQPMHGTASGKASSCAQLARGTGAPSPKQG